jgi:hypothetical protein
MAAPIKIYSLESYFEAFTRFRSIFGDSIIKQEPYKTMIRQSAEALERGQLVIIRHGVEMTSHGN